MMVRDFSRFLALALLLTATTARAADPVSLVSVSGQGNLNAGGVVVTIKGDTNTNASATLEWRPSGGTFRAGHPLVRIDATHFLGSLFWLAPNTSYDARITLSDPDGVSGTTSATTSFQTRVDTLPEPTLRTLFVAPNGNDANPGTSSSAPLRTIQHAADVAQAGDLVLVAAGIYRENVVVPRSGTASQPIVFRGASGAILDGADARIEAGVTWASEGSGVFSLVPGFTTANVVTELGRLFPYASIADLQALAAGAPGGFFFDGTRLYVKFQDGSSPANHTMHVARLEQAFYIDGRSFVRVERFEIRHYGIDAFGKGVYLRFSSDCAVRSCLIHEFGEAGVWVKGGSRHRLEDNEIFDTSITGWPWALVKASADNGGMVFSDDLGPGHVVRRNTIHGTFNGINPCGSLPPASGVTTEIDVHDNQLFQIDDDAIEADGYCANVRVWNNRIRDVHMAVSVAPAAPGPVWIVRNVVFRDGNTRSSQLDGQTASPLKINSGDTTTVGPVFLYQNTLYTDAAQTNGVTLLNPGNASFIRARNNVIAGTFYALRKVNPVAWDGDGDDLFTTDPTRFVFWNDTRIDTLAAFRAIGQELNGINAAPQFVSAADGDLTPASGSPLIDAGRVIPGINDDFLGTAPDIGAIESAGAPPPPPPPPPSPEVAHWTFDEGAGNVASDGIAGIVCTLAGQSWIAGHTGSAVQFSGTSSGGDCGTATPVQLTNAATVALWVKVSAPSRFADMRLVSTKTTAGATSGYDLTYNPGKQLLTFHGSGSDSATARKIALGTGWHHVAAVVSGTSVRLYVDGVDRTNDGTATALAAGTTPLRLGRDGQGNFLAGAMDELRFFNRALTASEVAQVMAGSL